jgi:hypothetical protein
MKSLLNVFVMGLLAIGSVVATQTPAEANHSWGCYHWAGSNPRVLTFGDNVTSNWDSYLTTAEQDWEQSTVLSTSVVAGQANSKNCRPGTGKIEVCNSTYGNNGWLGIAQIWVSGCHITKGSSKVNDTYFNQPQYNTPAWRRLVMCQEIAHDFGLDHQDENFNNANLGTCMDYTSDPDGPPSNEHPNSHDYAQLQTIYGHVDGAALASSHEIATTPAPPAMDQIEYNSRAQWGKLIESSSDGRVQVFELDFGNGHKILTHVFWAIPSKERPGKEKPSRSR